MNDYLCAVLLNETYPCQCKYNDIMGVGTPQKYLNPCILARSCRGFLFIRTLVNWAGETTAAINQQCTTAGFCQGTAIVQRNRSQDRWGVPTSKANSRRKHGTYDLRSIKRWNGSIQPNIKLIAGDNLNITIRDKYCSAIAPKLTISPIIKEYKYSN